jgi:hypothetical protein
MEMQITGNTSGISQIPAMHIWFSAIEDKQQVYKFTFDTPMNKIQSLQPTGRCDD